jgi:phosphoribosyl 1,2-cyclic phosphodiesterase
MRFAYLGSGSQGNGLVVEAGSTRVLLDCGFALRETTTRLERLGVDPGSLDAIVVTHEHDDHVGGVGRLGRKFGIPVWLTHGTLRGVGDALEGAEVRLVEGYAAFQVGDVYIEPFPVPHDAGEPAQFVFGDGARRLGVLTDTGMATAHIQACLSGVDALALECNHDLDMLRASAYPPSLQQRISGRLGHLDNAAAARLLASLERSALQHVVAVHLSQKNNTPDRARAALAGALGCEPDWVAVADQSAGLGWRQIV